MKISKTVAICNANTLVRAYRNLELNKLLIHLILKHQMDFLLQKHLKILYKNNQKRVDGYKFFMKQLKMV